MTPSHLIQNRENLITHCIKSVLNDKKLIEVFYSVPRHEFVPAKYKEEAYLDNPLPIGKEQTISQPSLVAQMTKALELQGNEKVLEIGTGSGYQTAILSRLCKQVVSIEYVASLAIKARDTLRRLHYKNVHVIHGDGKNGCPKEAPFDAIIVTAAAYKIPPALIEQLKINGKMVIPIKINSTEMLTKVIKFKDRLEYESLGIVRFVPLI